MKYKPELGMIGNVKRTFVELTNTNIRFSSETSDRKTADTENREAVEQSLTDLYLDGVQTQQDLTDLQIQILEGAK